MDVDTAYSTPGRSPPSSPSSPSSARLASPPPATCVLVPVNADRSLSPRMTASLSDGALLCAISAPGVPSKSAASQGGEHKKVCDRKGGGGGKGHSSDETPCGRNVKISSNSTLMFFLLSLTFLEPGDATSASRSRRWRNHYCLLSSASNSIP